MGVCSVSITMHFNYTWSRLKRIQLQQISSYIEKILIVDTVSKKTRSKPPNLSSMLDVADRMSHATSVRFTYGVAYQLNEYTADGTIFDFMAGKRKVS